MPTLEYETQISGYVSGYTVTVAIDSAQVLADFGLPYDHIELQTSGGVTVQTSTGTSVVVTDTSCIFQDIYSNWVVGYALYCDDSGTPVRQFYSGSPNAISASAAPSGFSADSVVVQLQDGSKASIGLSAVTAGDKCVVIPLQDGSKVVKKLEKCYTGDIVTVMQLQDGSKVALHNSSNPHPKITDIANMLTGVYDATEESQNLRARMTVSKQSGVTSVGYAKVKLGVTDAGVKDESVIIVCDDIPAGGITIETPDIFDISEEVTHLWCYVEFDKGAYVSIDNVQISFDSGVSWGNHLPDGDFSLGYFTGDGGTGWILHEYGFSAQMVSGACESCDL